MGERVNFRFLSVFMEKAVENFKYLNSGVLVVKR
tara:strand:- start:60 stop:161 length:102 start_codon:yes stop_codon:yes gene_type:complete